jgi:hypothetical protein
MADVNIILSEEEVDELISILTAELSFPGNDDESMKMYKIMRKIVNQRKSIFADEEREKLR